MLGLDNSAGALQVQTSGEASGVSDGPTSIEVTA
jgi:hypothetical protein